VHLLERGIGEQSEPGEQRVRYILISTFPSTRSNGITTYLQHVQRMLEEWGIAATCIANEEQLPGVEFRQRVRDEITTRFRPDEVLIEAPETGAPTMLLPPAYRVHIRLHCPTAFVQRHNGIPVGLEQFENELHVARTAYITSSPSHALLRELEPYVDVSWIHVYKNPPPEPSPIEREAKTLDVVFMGNFSRLKGVDFLNPLLRRFPPHYSVVLAGRDSEDFEIATDVRCEVRVGAHIQGPERLALLGRARAALSLSRFENCSMTVLESLAVGTVVAGWRVGGHPEIAGPRLIRLVSLGDVDALATTVAATVEGAYPSPAEFRAAAAAIREDFRQGWSRVWTIATGTSPPAACRSLDRPALTA
jgi:glycosyltransferase involved in cell wall biosynthesis